jgi:hypothetical protein
MKVRKVVYERFVKNRESYLKCLSSLDKNVLMLFRTNNYLRTIENKLGSPINPVKILANYVYNTLYEEKIKLNKDVIWQNLIKIQ